MKKRTEITAEELVRRLEADPDYHRRVAEREKRHAKFRAAVDAENAQVCAALAAVGVNVDSVSDFHQAEGLPNRAVPVLLDWLAKAQVPNVKEMIARTLSIPKANREVVRALITEFEQSTKLSEDGVKWAIGNALSEAAGPADFDDLVRLARERHHGSARQMLLIAIGRCEASVRDRALAILLDLLDDPVVQGHALIGLRHLNDERARLSIEQMLNHEKPWIQKEARAALAKLEKGRP